MMEHKSKLPQRRGAAELAGKLRTQINSGEWCYNDRLPSERELARTMGAARGTVREALLRLKREGLIKILPNSGAYVCFILDTQADTIISQTRPLELMDTRFALEPHICRLSVLHGQMQDFRQMAHLVTELNTCGHDPKKFAELDAQFHLTLVKSTGNSLLIWIISQINSVRIHDQWYQMRKATLNNEMIDIYNAQHRQILDSIRSRKPEQAARHMKEHLQSVRHSLTRTAEG